MANKMRGEATIKVDDRELTLRLDFNTFCDIETSTGLDIQQLGPALSKNPSATVLRALVCACLQHHHPGTTERQAGEILSIVDHEEIGEVLGKLFEAAMPAPDPRNGAPRAETRRGAGKR
ncbi:hypothetical protein [Sphingomonas sanxanigenens]|uniref:Gene transfer agent protein n=1 Tax=Sphingomonas sanxanigenens DSM 19645 = NX02 TaxID=1123269 RepID=W0A8J1_9SPHN|nr:hypothetical protein [Sphingomonas sanxanigenens]AHE52638.1 hypothetical protein NX02_04470 [Sphingomonas sanxanigenens DSM 19645 = NX02]